MKKIFYFICFVLLAMSCTKPKEVELELGADPDSRVSDTLAYVRKTLIDAPYGWKASLTTEYSGGYGFYMQFGSNDRIKMVADLNDNTASVPKESTYRIRQIMAATLSFDTYTYLTMLQDPTPSTFGGQAGKGMGSDVEFDYVKTHGDTLFFEGRKFQKPLKLVKATKIEQESYMGGGYEEAVNKFKNYFANNPFSKLSIGDTQFEFGFDYKGKSTTLEARNSDGSFSTLDAAVFAFTLNGIEFVKGLPYKDVILKEIIWEGSSLIAVDKNGKKYSVNKSNAPFRQLYEVIGTKYSELVSDYKSYLPGTSADGLTILKRFHDGLGNGAAGFYFNYGYMDLNWEKDKGIVTLIGFSSQNGGTSGWETKIVYDYTFNETTKAFTFKLKQGASGGYVGGIMDKMDSFLKTNSFTLEYYVANGVICGMLRSVQNPSITMTFDLY
ncbi:MAG: hypothetical protein K0S31_3793 [Sphingobacterium multivorum]|jgi:hypothetical protein|nr:hypothetical protein [Sphingobacterium multivorum]